MTTLLDRPAGPRVPTPVRVTLTEGRRSSAPLLFIAVFGTGTILLFVHPDRWAGRWLALAGYLRLTLLLVVPLCAAVAAWQGGRERRRAMDDLLAATSRPGWHAMLTTWIALVSAAAGGLFAIFLLGSAFVLPYATYAGGSWYLLAIGCLPAVAAAIALGLAVGRWVPFRVIGLLLAVTLYVGLAVPAYLSDSPIMWLDPMIEHTNGYDQITVGTQALQALWLVGLSLTLLSIAAAGRAASRGRPLVAIALGVVVATLGAAPLLSGPGYDRTVPDAAARRQVCASGTPRVCLAAVDAYLLDDLTPRLRRVLRRLATVPGAPHHAVGGGWGGAPPSDTLVVVNLVPNLTGGLVDDARHWGDPVQDAVTQSLSAPACFASQVEVPGWEQRLDVENIAAAWILTSDQDASFPAAARGLRTLSAMTLAGQRAWVSRVYATRDSCELATETALLVEVGVTVP